MAIGKYLKLASTGDTPPQDDGRADLRAAIRRRDDVHAERLKLERAVARAAKAVDDAASARDRAMQASRKAREDAQAQTLAAMRAGKDAPAAGLSTARQAEADAAEAYELAKNAYETLSAELEALSVEDAERDVEKAARAVIMSHAERLLEEARAVRADLIQRTAVLAWINSECRSRHVPAPDLERQIDRFAFPPVNEIPVGQYLDLLSPELAASTEI